MFRDIGLPDEIKKKCGWNHFKFTEEERKEKFGTWKDKHSPKLGKKLTNEQRQNISKARKGKNKGHIVSEETRRKIGEKAKNRNVGPKNIDSVNKSKQTNERVMFVKRKEYEIYKQTHNISWNEWQSLFSDFIKEEQIKFNLNKPLNEKLNERQFKRYFYENRWARFVNQ